MKKLILLFTTSLLLFACGAEDDGISANSSNNDGSSSAINSYSAKDFMSDYNIKLTAKEVQYDMANKLDREFYIEGKMELCDYYNYGHTNEKELMCTMIIPPSGKYDDSWYVYLRRAKFGDLYNKLLNGNIDVKVSAIILSQAYQKGQGNMAGGLVVAYE